MELRKKGCITVHPYSLNPKGYVTAFEDNRHSGRETDCVAGQNWRTDHDVHGKYIEAFFTNIDWNTVEIRLT